MACAALWLRTSAPQTGSYRPASVSHPPGTDEAEALCASFDHAASLGFTLSDSARGQHLCDRTIARWAARGQARRFDHRRGDPWQSLVDLAKAALVLCPDRTREHWV
jgi:hypothetical protein